MPEPNTALATSITNSYGNGGDLTMTFSVTDTNKYFYYIGAELPE